MVMKSIGESDISYCEKDGKDKIIFLSKEDYNTLPVLDKELEKALFEDDPDEPRGLILPNGDINWNCPCLGNMASGPCTSEFKEAFSCFHVSQAEPKGSDCFEQFKTMQGCFEKYPKVYGDQNGEDPASVALGEKDVGSGVVPRDMNSTTDGERQPSNDQTEIAALKS